MIFPLLTSGFLLSPPFMVVRSANEEITIITVASVEVGESFDIDVSLMTEANKNFYLKARLGQIPAQLSKAQTYNSTTNSWLSDQSAWTGFPTVATDGEGRWQGKVSARAIASVVLGKNYLVLRARELVSGQLIDSPIAEINLTAKIQPPQNSATIFEPKTIKLSEIMPNPSSGEEWVEVFNSNNLEVDLTGWKIADNSTGKPYELPVASIIPSKGFLIVNFRNKFNNSGDSVRLFSNTGSLVEETSFVGIDKGSSYAKSSKSSWFVSTKPTPGSPNPDPPKPATKTIPKVEPTQIAAATPTNATEAASNLPQTLAAVEKEVPKNVIVAPTEKNNASQNLSLILFALGGFLFCCALGYLGYEQVYKK